MKPFHDFCVFPHDFLQKSWFKKNVSSGMCVFHGSECCYFVVCKSVWHCPHRHSISAVRRFQAANHAKKPARFDDFRRLKRDGLGYKNLRFPGTLLGCVGPSKFDRNSSEPLYQNAIQAFSTNSVSGISLQDLRCDPTWGLNMRLLDEACSMSLQALFVGSV